MRIHCPSSRKNIIGRFLKEHRNQTDPKMTQQDISDRLKAFDLDLDRYAISRIEAGTRFVADYEIAAIARALDIDVDTLLNIK